MSIKRRIRKPKVKLTKKIVRKTLPKKTARVKVKAKPGRRKASAHEKLCDDLCNRLQAGEHRPIVADLLDNLGISGGGLDDLTEALLTRHPVTICTRPYKPHFAVSAYIHAPDVGHKMNHAPKKYVVYSSNELWLSVTIAYIKLSKHAGKFL